MDEKNSYSAYSAFAEDHKTFGYQRLDDTVIAPAPSLLRRALHRLSGWFAPPLHKKVETSVKTARTV